MLFAKLEKFCYRSPIPCSHTSWASCWAEHRILLTTGDLTPRTIRFQKTVIPETVAANDSPTSAL
ncbi:hypothetical protein BDW66DRAFT_141119 [Aspergillus desertorum]